jgi:hypothetical protein
MTADNDEEEWNEQSFFVDCTCAHEPEEHGWGCCNVTGCPCEGGWEE